MGRRTAVGLIAVVLLAGGVWLNRFGPQQASATLEALHAACWRVGALMAVIWLAYPQVSRVPPWLFGACFVSAIVIAARPRLAVIVLPLLGVIWGLSLLGKMFAGAAKDTRRTQPPPKD